MTLNEFVIQILADKMAKELMNDPTLFLLNVNGWNVFDSSDCYDSSVSRCDKQFQVIFFAEIIHEQ